MDDSHTSSFIPITNGKIAVIIGGGVAGSLLASSLQFIADVTHIDPGVFRNSMGESPIDGRAVVRGAIDHPPLILFNRAVVSHAISITGTQVVTTIRDGTRRSISVLIGLKRRSRLGWLEVGRVVSMVVAENVKVLMNGGKENKMSVYKTKSSKTIVSLGRRDAVAQYSLTTVVGLVAGDDQV